MTDFKKVGPSEIKPNYPRARRDETIVENINGRKIVDPYRWLEIPGKSEVQIFSAEQDRLTRKYIRRCLKTKEIQTRVQNLSEFQRNSCPTTYDHLYSYYKNEGLQNQSILFVKDHILDSFKTLIDPNGMAADGSIAIHHYAFNGKIVAYALSINGSDWLTVRFKDIAGNALPDVLTGVNLSRICWNSGNPPGIFYSRFLNEGKLDGTETEPNTNHKLFFHKIGTNQSDDLLVADFPEYPNALIDVKITTCGNYILISLRQQPDQNKMLYLAKLEYIFKDDEDLLPSQLMMTPLTRGFTHNYEYIFNEGTMYYFRTNRSASNYCISRTDLNNLHTWQTVVPEQSNDVIDWACSVGGGKVFICYICDCCHRLDLCRLSDGTTIKTFKFSWASITEYKIDAEALYFKVESFFIPERIYRISLVDNIAGWEAKIFRRSIAPGINPQDYIVQQVLCRSKDQTKVPMFILHKKELEIGTGNTPCWIYVYGGYGVSTLPCYSADKMVFMKHFNGIVVMVNIRGGGEFGVRWHDAGRLFKKANCFHDLHAAASYLIDKKYTRPSKIVIEGHSNGGLVVAACINQRPDLYGAAIINRGILDMLRYHKFTIGRLWCGEFGSSDDSKEAENLLTYSPMHNIARPEGYDAKIPVQFPSVLALTSDHDDRVVPLHSLKYIATLQHIIGPNPEQTNPLLLRYELGTGHSRRFGRPMSKMLEEMTDVLCFMSLVLDLDFRAY